MYKEKVALTLVKGRSSSVMRSNRDEVWCIMRERLATSLWYCSVGSTGYSSSFVRCSTAELRCVPRAMGCWRDSSNDFVS
jgi:hypothetical protein